MPSPTVKATFTANISQFRQSLAEASTVVTAFEKTTSQVNSQLKRFGNEFSGAKVRAEAEAMARAIADIGGASALTDANLKRVNGTIKEAIQQYERLGKQAPDSIRSLNAELDTLLVKSKQIDAAVPDKATKGFSLMQGAVAGVAAAISSQALSSIKQFASDIIKTGGDIADLSAKTGLTTNQVQRFGYAAAQTGSSVEQITGAVSQLSDRLVEGGTGTVAAVQKLGLSFDDLRRQNPAAAFEQIASAIKDVPDPMQQTQLAMELFGKSGAEILPAIKAGITELGDEAEKLGLVIDGSAIKALDDFGDQWDQMSLRAKVSAAGVLSDTLRIVQALSDVGAAAARALPNELRDSPIGRRLQSAGPFSFGAASIYGASSRFTNEYLLPPQSSDLPDAPAARPLPFGAGASGIGAAEMRYAEQQTDAAIRKLEESLRKGEEAARKLREELNKLTGRDIVANATTLAKQIEMVGMTNVLPRSLPTFVEQLQEGLDRARALGPSFAGSARQIQDALQQAVNSPAYREFFQRSLKNPTIGLGERSNFSGITGSALTNAITGGLPASTVPDMFDTFDAARASRSIAGITVDFQKGIPAIRSWRTELQGVSQSFANLAQIAGPSMSGVARGIGVFVSSLDAAQQLVTSLGKSFNKDFKFGDSTGGKLAASGLAAGFTGWQIGMQGGMSPGRAALAGAGSGALQGAYYGGAGFAVGAVVGATSAYFGAQKAEEELRKAKDLQAEILVAQYGSLDALMETVGALGMNEQTFLERFYGEPKEFAKGVTDLSNALVREQKEADKLAKALTEVARVQGVLSRDQMVAITNVRPGGPGAEAVVEFARQQRGQAEAGISTAIAALNTATAGGTKNLDRFQSSISAVTGSLSALFGAAVKDGESAVSVLKRLADPIKALSELLKGGGLSGGAGFEQLQVLSEIASGADTGPLVEMASGLGSALAGLANTGMLSPELFGDLANGIGEAYKQLELLGKGGLEAARLMQPGLQAIWQMIQDNPALRDELDDTTLALLDFAEQSGLIGEGFRPAIDRMMDAIGDLIDKIGDLIDAISTVPGITVPVTYEPGEFPEPPPSTNPGRNFDGSEDRDGDPTTPLALGGIVTRPTRALIGEAGPEAVIPLRQYQALMQSQLGPSRPWSGASANHDETSAIVGRIEPVLTAATTRMASALDVTTAQLQEWASRVVSSSRPWDGDRSMHLPTAEERERQRQELIAATGGQWTGEAPDGPPRIRLEDGDERIKAPAIFTSPDEAGIDLTRLRPREREPFTIVNVTQLDGREVARTVNRYQGDERRLVGVA
jgi:hypothetical protein